MAWIQTESLSFVTRHEAEDSDCAQRTLDALEDLRLRLEDRFDDVPAGITVIVHPTPGWLAAAHPFLPAARLAAASAGRRYLAGWHCLARRPAGHRGAPVREDRGPRQQKPPAPAMGTTPLPSLPALDLAD